MNEIPTLKPQPYTAFFFKVSVLKTYAKFRKAKPQSNKPQAQTYDNGKRITTNHRAQKTYFVSNMTAISFTNLPQDGFIKKNWFNNLKEICYIKPTQYYQFPPDKLVCC